VRIIEEFDWLSNAYKWKNLAYLIEVRSKRQKIGEAASEIFRRFDILDKAQSKKFGLRQSLGIEKSSSG
jgi:hypothetical protein